MRISGMGMKSVFIQIPSYRDLELQKTIVDAVYQSSGENYLHFGVHNCYLTDDEMQLDYPKFENAKVSQVNSLAPQNIGLQLSRKIANNFYDEEDFYLQIDSHMRFVKNWDKHLIDAFSMYQYFGINKPLITQYPSTYSYDAHMNERYVPSREVRNIDYHPTRISFHENKLQFSNIRIPSQTAMSMNKHCAFTASVSGGFIFTEGSFHQITPNPKIAFWGEEPLIAARAFTSGFDLVVPHMDIVWHLYASGQEQQYVRRHHAWQDFPEIWPKLDSDSKAEYFRIMTQREIGRYALGSERSLDDFEQFAGLDFRTGKVTQIDLR
jgi:hypothetical protein